MNEIFKVLLDSIYIPIWIKDLDLNYIFVNNKYAELNNKKKADFIGIKNENIFNPETAKMYNNRSNEVIKTLESRTTEEFIDNAYKECRDFYLERGVDNILGKKDVQGLSSILK